MDFKIRYDFARWVQGEVEVTKYFFGCIMITDHLLFKWRCDITKLWMVQKPNLTIEYRDRYSFKWIYLFNSSSKFFSVPLSKFLPN